MQLSIFVVFVPCWLFVAVGDVASSGPGAPGQVPSPSSEERQVLESWLSEEDMDFLRWEEDLRKTFYTPEAVRVTRGVAGEPGPILVLRKPELQASGGGAAKVDLPLEVEFGFGPRPPRQTPVDVSTLTIVGWKRKFGRWWSKDVTRAMLGWVDEHSAEGAVFDGSHLYLPLAGFKPGMYQFDVSIDDVEGHTSTVSYRFELQ